MSGRIIDFKTYHQAKQVRRRDVSWVGEAGRKRLDGIRAIHGEIAFWRSFLYLKPSETEQLLSPMERPNWTQVINKAETRDGLGEVISFLKPEVETMWIMNGDRVIVVSSTTPFYDSLGEGGDHLASGEWQAYLGEVSEYHYDDACADGKIRQGYALINARKLTKEDVSVIVEVKRWGPEYRQVAQQTLSDRFRNFTLGNERVKIFEEFSKLDCITLGHVVKEEEKAVADISRSDLYLDLTPYYGQRRIEGGKYCFATAFTPDSSFAIPAFLVDGGSMELYLQLLSPVTQRLKECHQLTELGLTAHLLFLKKAYPALSEQDFDFLMRLPSWLRPSWQLKFIREKGFHFPGQLMIALYLTRKHGASAREEEIQRFQGQIVRQISELLSGVKSISSKKLILSYGMWGPNEDKLLAELKLDPFLQSNSTTWMGEYLEFGSPI